MGALLRRMRLGVSTAVAAVLLCAGGPGAAAPAQPQAEVRRYKAISLAEFSVLREHAAAFARARASAGFGFTEGRDAATSFQITCGAAPVLAVEHRAAYLQISVAADAAQWAPGIAGLQQGLQRWLAPLPRHSASAGASPQRTLLRQG